MHAACGEAEAVIQHRATRVFGGRLNGKPRRRYFVCRPRQASGSGGPRRPHRPAPYWRQPCTTRNCIYVSVLVFVKTLQSTVPSKHTATHATPRDMDGRTTQGPTLLFG